MDADIRKHRKSRIFLVDVRSRKAYETLKIPGSLNIPRYAVKTRPFLKSRPIVLVNEGFAFSLLEQECRKLNQKGFKAYILDGGLNAWSYKNGPLEGDLFSIKTFSTVSSRIFHQEKDFKNTIVIDISEVQSSTSLQLFPGAIHLPAIGASAKQPMKNLPLSDMSASVRDIMKTSNSATLITNQDGKGYDDIQQEFEKKGIAPVFYLQGGMDAYEAFLNRLALSRQLKDARMKTIRQCAPCGQKEKE